MTEYRVCPADDGCDNQRCSSWTAHIYDLTTGDCGCDDTCSEANSPCRKATVEEVAAARLRGEI